MDVFFYETFAEERHELEKCLPKGIEAEFAVGTIQETGHVTPPAPIISIRTQSTIPLSWADSLQAIVARSAGYDHLTAYRQNASKKISYGYLPQYCARAVAEQATLLMLALLRKLPLQVQHFQTFHRDNITGRECLEKTLVVVGVGNIGYQIVNLGRALGMHVLGVDIVRRRQDVEYVTIDEGLALADIVICAMNLTPRNHGYFNYEQLKKAKPGAIFINVARGEFSPAPDLLRLLDEQTLSGVGLDVYNEETQLAVHLREGSTPTSPEIIATLALSKRPNCILTPHNAFNTAEAVSRKASQTVEQIEHFLKNGQFLWALPEEE